ncbi:restriction endonuclease subunit S [Deinococcus soli (ex Cha et al. 2016)]|uniref:Type I restriction enzyme S subunit n=3 Tax=Deinococcus soli (ex Cha et al. 2016) TaxID=1309411 RepID=A0ACC6KJG4_9DEIO|nr:restriction endonuclease subunit S [Deinococcus soli (ex Cha et al. 2016)]MDR6219842.1 type I restriction enzyme S subunit [Deinococcus soli (ex Cha et al. 2016)]MDR6329900.1 type I restriction enzyme S subunit [Deinococcus soli (ex Cha et al. 2016)]MDR6752749.1 type I restriction enzyme S subunit [Deinococcus soli (ex Cha et al. 2016)]
MIRTTNVKSGVIDLETVRYVTEETYRTWTRRQVPRSGDVILTREAPLGEVGMLKEADGVFLGQRLMSYRADPDKLDAHFLLYALQEDHLQDQIRATGAGATVEHMRVPDAEKLRIKLPPLATQRKIASILSAYDDLIENNARRVRVLEEMARALYREWFVEYRFPGHEQAEFVEAEQGRRPVGWEWLPFSEMFDSTLGGDWGSEKAQGADVCPVRVIRGTDFEDIAGGAPIRCPTRFIDAKSLFKRKLQAHDLILENSINAKTRSAGTPFLIDAYTLEMLGSDSIAASFCKVYRPKAKYVKLIPLAYLYLDHMVMTKRMEYFQNIAANGIANLQSQKLIAEGKILVPPAHVLDKILALLGDTQSKVLAYRIQNLRCTRDLLLPKLVSGELDVSVLDISGAEDAQVSAEEVIA